MDPLAPSGPPPPSYESVVAGGAGGGGPPPPQPTFARDFEIAVKDPAKVGDGMTSYITYRARSGRRAAPRRAAALHAAPCYPRRRRQPGAPSPTCARARACACAPRPPAGR